SRSITLFEVEVHPSLARCRGRRERFLSEESIESAKGDGIVRLQQCFEIDFQIVAGAGGGAVREQAPGLAIGQYGPADLPIRVVVDFVEVSDKLGGGVARV